MPNSVTKAVLPPTPKFDLFHDPWGRLVLVDADGRKHVGVEPLRDFPLSDPQHWISICDVEGRELACIADVDALPEKVRDTLLDDLARREFVPVIERVEEITSGVDPTQWTVETDRGRTVFSVKGDDDVRRLGPRRALVVDAFGIRYLIPDTQRLDVNSRRLVERFL